MGSVLKEIILSVLLSAKRQKLAGSTMNGENIAVRRNKVDSVNLSVAIP